MPLTRSFPLAALALLACAHPGAAPAAVHPAPAAARGRLFIVGGGPQPPALVRRFVELAGGAAHARIVVFGMASAYGAQAGAEKVADFEKYGAHAVNVFLTHAQANTDSAAHLLDGATGVWFVGGDQSRLTAAIGQTRVEQAIHARYRAGAVIGGTSAGAAVMSNPMITGDQLHPGGVRPVTDSTNYMTIARGNMVLARGFGFVRDAIIDQHFLRRRRANRLISVVLDDSLHLGAGIDESTALLVHRDGHWSVMGESAVVIFDARHATITPPRAPVLGAIGVRMLVLPAGSTYDPATGRATLPAGNGSASR